MTKQTEYKNSFQKVQLSENFVPTKQSYIPNNSPFECKSTHKSDFLKPEKITKMPNFSPKNQYMAVPDNRNFLTENKGQLSVKQLPICPAIGWMREQREIRSDGHIYLKA
jgi:hypothetical protein